jgi:hypothetical protein
MIRSLKRRSPSGPFPEGTNVVRSAWAIFAGSMEGPVMERYAVTCSGVVA